MNQENKLTKIFITKYALTKGIYSVVAEIINPQFAVYRNKPELDQYFHNNDFWFDEKEAIQHVLDTIIKKQNSLDKQIKKLSKLGIELAKTLHHEAN